MGCEGELLVQHVCRLYDQISNLSSLEPSKEVNRLFTELVHACIPPIAIDVTKLCDSVQQIRSNLIKLCGEAEGQLESHFSSILGSFSSPLDHLNLFPYYSNYIKLAKLEYDILMDHCSHLTPNKIAFVGSGSLPLTSIVLASNHLPAAVFHNYDVDPLANSKAFCLVSSHPDLSKRVFFHTTDILRVTDELKQYDVVFLAALVGMDKEEKSDVIAHLSKFMDAGSYLMLRSAHGARGFLYPVVEACDIRGFDVLSVFHPTDEVINSVVIARKFSLPSSDMQEKHHVLLPNKCSEIQVFNPLHRGNMLEDFAIEADQLT